MRGGWGRVVPVGKGWVAAAVRPRVFVSITVYAAGAPAGCSSVLTFSPNCPISGLALGRGICWAPVAIEVGAMLRAPLWRTEKGINVYERGIVG